MPRKSKKASIAVQAETGNLIRDMTILLLELEFCDNHGGDPFCHLCEGRLGEKKPRNGHTEVCKLDALLTRMGAR